jgi:hypothetical protein
MSRALMLAAALCALVATAHAARAGNSLGVDALKDGDAPVTAAAIAVNGRGNWGFAVGYGQWDLMKAGIDARKGCGADDCKVVAVGTFRCVAYTEARGRDGAFWYWVATGDPVVTGARSQAWCSAVAEARAAGCRTTEKCP